MRVAEVLVAMPDAALRRDVRAALDADPRILVVADVADPVRTITLAAALRPEVVVVEWCDVESVTDLRQVCPGVVVVEYGAGTAADAAVPRSAPLRRLVDAVVDTAVLGHRPDVVDLRDRTLTLPEPRSVGALGRRVLGMLPADIAPPRRRR